jgi:flagellar biosynthesis GTPase FlhF
MMESDDQTTSSIMRMYIKTVLQMHGCNMTDWHGEHNIHKLLGLRQKCPVEEEVYQSHKQLILWLNPDKFLRQETEELMQQTCQNWFTMTMKGMPTNQLHAAKLFEQTERCRESVAWWFSSVYQPAYKQCLDWAGAEWKKLTCQFHSEWESSHLFDLKRSHDNWTLHWFENMGFKTLLTEMEVFVLNMQDNAALPPTGCKDSSMTRDVTMQFYTGKLKLLDLFERYDAAAGIVLNYAEPCKLQHLAGRILQENLLAMHVHTMKGGRHQEWKLAIAINIHRFPLREDASAVSKVSKDTFVGLNTFQHSLLDVHFWPLIDKIIVMDEQRAGQFGIFSGHVKRNSHYCLVVFSSGNTNARKLVTNMVNGTEEPDLNQYCPINWGTHRVDVSFLEKKQVEHKDQRLLLFKWLKAEFPQTLLHTNPNVSYMDMNPSKFVSHKVSIDFVEGNKWAANSKSIQNMIDNYSQMAELAKAMKHTNCNVHINPVSRRSYASWGQELMTAWDVALETPEEDDNDEVRSKVYQLCMALWETFKEYQPYIGPYDLYHINMDRLHGMNFVILEFTWAGALMRLMELNIVAWTLMIGFKSCAVQFCKKTQDGQSLSFAEMVEKIHDFNQKVCSTDSDLGHIERIIVSSREDVQTAIKEQGLDCKGQLLYDRRTWNKAKWSRAGEMGDLHSAKLEVKDEKQVEVTLTNLNYMPLPQLAQLLQDNITKYVQQYFPDDCKKAMEAESEDAQACLILVKQPKNHGSVVITCKSKTLASLLCRKVGSIQTRQGGAFIGELKFQSRFHQLWKEDYKQKFQMLCLKDGTTGTVVHQESSQGPASSAASMRSAAADVLLRHQPQQQQAAQTQQQQDQQQQTQQQQDQQQQAQQTHQTQQQQDQQQQTQQQQDQQQQAQQQQTQQQQDQQQQAQQQQAQQQQAQQQQSYQQQSYQQQSYQQPLQQHQPFQLQQADYQQHQPFQLQQADYQQHQPFQLQQADYQQQQHAQQHLQQPQHQPSAHWHQQHQHSMWVQRTMLHYDHGQARNVHGNSSSSNELE